MYSKLKVTFHASVELENIELNRSAILNALERELGFNQDDTDIVNIEVLEQ
jgi:hypothetical protein